MERDGKEEKRKIGVPSLLNSDFALASAIVVFLISYRYVLSHILVLGTKFEKLCGRGRKNVRVFNLKLTNGHLT